MDFVDLAAALDRRVTVHRLEPSLRRSVQGLERLHFRNARPEEHGALMGGAFREEAFEVRPVCEDDRDAGGCTARRESDSARLPRCEPARSGFVDPDHRYERLRSEVPEPRGRFGKTLRVRERAPRGVGGRELEHEAVVCDLAHLHVWVWNSRRPTEWGVLGPGERGLVQKYRCAQAERRRRGSSASRSASPRKLKAKTAVKMATPGPTLIHHLRLARYRVE